MSECRLQPVQLLVCGVISMAACAASAQQAAVVLAGVSSLPSLAIKSVRADDAQVFRKTSRAPQRTVFRSGLRMESQLAAANDIFSPGRLPSSDKKFQATWRPGVLVTPAVIQADYRSMRPVLPLPTGPTRADSHLVQAQPLFRLSLPDSRTRWTAAIQRISDMHFGMPRSPSADRQSLRVQGQVLFSIE